MYDEMQQTLEVCSTQGFTPRYRLWTPRSGLSCYKVLAGWTFSKTLETLDVYSIEGFAAEYVLK